MANDEWLFLGGVQVARSKAGWPRQATAQPGQLKAKQGTTSFGEQLCLSVLTMITLVNCCEGY